MLASGESPLIGISTGSLSDLGLLLDRLERLNRFALETTAQRPRRGSTACITRDQFLLLLMRGGETAMVATFSTTPRVSDAPDTCGCKTGMVWTQRALGVLIPLAALRVVLAPGRRAALTSTGLVAAGVFVSGGVGKAVGITRSRRHAFGPRPIGVSAP